MTSTPQDDNEPNQLSENKSSMHIRTFRAANLQEALEQIRQQMGSEAAVLHTRQVRDGWMGWLGRTYVEVTAGLRDEESAVQRHGHKTQREKERCSGSYRLAVGFLIIKDESIS